MIWWCVNCEDYSNINNKKVIFSEKDFILVLCLFGGERSGGSVYVLKCA